MTLELVVAEKPKVAQKIAYAIGKNVRVKKRGTVSYYEAEYNGKQLVVAPAVGHIYTLAEKEKRSNDYPVFDIEWKPSYEVDKDAAYTKQYVDILESFGKKADTFVCACDYDIEGSLIGYNVFRFAHAGKDARRMKFSALTDADLVEAHESMDELDYNNAYAGEARHILDWFYGINLSRALMSALKSAARYKVMSIGRVQGPTLGLVSELEHKIKAFIPTHYWELSIHANDTEFLHANGRFLDENEAKHAHDKTKEPAVVSTIEKKDFSVQPLPPFDLTSLQMEAYRCFGSSPSRTLQTAQSLYEGSLISYPRTSSQQYPPTLNLVSILKSIAKNPAYSSMASTLIENKQLTPVQGKKQDPAHPAIHPTGLQPEKQLHDSERKLYDLIVRRFLVGFASPAKKERTKVEIDANGEKYIASGVVTSEPGWIDFYGPYYKTEDKELPEFHQGSNVKIEKKKKTKKETKPPNRYSQASIIAEMESRHLGTKATRSNIVDTLYQRTYINGKSIKVSDFGLKVCDVLARHAPEILDENLTRKIEDDMEKIQEGKIEKEYVINEGKEILIQILDKWKKNEQKIGNDLLDALKISEEKARHIGICNKCGGNLHIIRLKAGRQFIGCSGYPNCRNAYPLPTGGSAASSDKICESCGLPMVFARFARAKRSILMCIDPNCPSKKDWKKKSDNNQNNNQNSQNETNKNETNQDKTEA